MSKEEYVNYLDLLISNMNNGEFGNYIYGFNELCNNLGIEDYVLDYDIYRRKLGLNTFYGMKELDVIDIPGGAKTLTRYKIYKNNLLFMGNVRFKPESYRNTMNLNNETVSYEIDSYGDYNVGYPIIKGDSCMFFDIKNKKMITLEDTEFAEYKES